ncbi:MAG TPA: RagB/SusD family nutrient uptake outer membrane protein [Longimicrobiales bacterium]
MLSHTTPTSRHAARILPAVLLLGLAAATSACDSLLDVDPSPHTVPADELNKPTSLEARLVGAEANFFLAYDMAIVFGGLFTDELADPGNAIDERRVTADNGLIGATDEAPEGIDGLWTPMQRAAFTSNQMQDDILAGSFGDLIPDPPNSSELARMSLFAGYSKLVLGELFCSTAFNGQGPEYTSEQTYQLAADELQMAIDAIDAATAGPEDLDVLYAAYVGRARALLEAGDLEGARAAAEQVPPDWAYIADVYSNNSSLEENDIWNMLTDAQRYTVAPDFRNLTIDDTGEDDPRVDVFQDPDDPFAIDGSTPLFQARKYTSPTSPIRFASGHEAQYILAEIAAAGGDAGTAVDIINEVRARYGITIQYASTDPQEVLTKLLDERGRTLFLEGQRMGDLRRFRERYGIDEFPTGDNYEDNVCMPLPNAERDNNPDI